MQQDSENRGKRPCCLHQPSPSFQVIDILTSTGRISVEALCRLSSLSKQSRESVAAAAAKCSIEDNWPLHYVQQAAEAEIEKCGDVQKCAATACWLASTVKDKLQFDQANTPEFLSIDCVPSDVAQSLVNWGLKATYQQLIEASSKRTMGAEVWARAMCTSHTPTGLPFWAELLCSGDCYLTSYGARLLTAAGPPPHLADALRLAFNMPKSSSAPRQILQAILDKVQAEPCDSTSIKFLHWKQWVNWADEQLDATLTEELFTTGCYRGHAEAVSLLERLKPDAVPASTVLTHLSDAVDQQEVPLVRVLSAHPAAQTCSITSYTPLLWRALDDRCEEAIIVLLRCMTSVAAQLPSDIVAALLEELLRCKYELCFRQLLRVPAVQHITYDQFYDVYHAAHSEHNQHLLPLLVKTVPVAQQLPAGYVSDLIELSLHDQSFSDFELYIRLPHAQDIHTEDFMEDMMSAVAIDDVRFLSQLCDLAPASGLDTEQVTRLLRSATIQHTSSAHMVELCTLDAAQNLDTTALSGLLTEAWETAEASKTTVFWECVSCLCNLPAAKQISGTAVSGWLQSAIIRGDRNAVHGICVLIDDKILAAGRGVDSLGPEAVTEIFCSAVAAPEPEPAPFERTAFYDTDDEMDQHWAYEASLEEEPWKHFNMLQLLCRSQLLPSLADASAVCTLIKGALATETPGALLEQLYAMPAYCKIGGKDMAALVIACMRKEQQTMIDKLLCAWFRCCLPSDAVSELVASGMQQAATEHGDEPTVTETAFVQRICSNYTVTKQLNMKILPGVLKTALTLKQLESFAVLNKLATWQWKDDHQVILSLLDQMIQGRVLQAVTALLPGHFAATTDNGIQITAAILQELIQRGLGGHEDVAAVWQSVALQYLPYSASRDLLELELQLKQHDSLARLLVIPAVARQLTAEHLVGLLHQAVETDNYEAVAVIVKSPVCLKAANTMSTDAVSGLLNAALVQGQSLRSVPQLCSLLAASDTQLTRDALSGLIKASLAAMKPLEYDVWLAGQPGTSQTSLPGQHCDNSMEKNSLDECRTVRANAPTAMTTVAAAFDVAQLEQAARVEVALHAVAALCRLKKAAQMDAADVVDLLQLAVSCCAPVAVCMNISRLAGGET